MDTCTYLCPTLKNETLNPLVKTNPTFLSLFPSDSRRSPSFTLFPSDSRFRTGRSCLSLSPVWTRSPLWLCVSFRELGDPGPLDKTSTSPPKRRRGRTIVGPWTHRDPTFWIICTGPTYEVLHRTGWWRAGGVVFRGLRFVDSGWGSIWGENFMDLTKKKDWPGNNCVWDNGSFSRLLLLLRLFVLWDLISSYLDFIENVEWSSCMVSISRPEGRWTGLRGWTRRGSVSVYRLSSRESNVPSHILGLKPLPKSFRLGIRLSRRVNVLTERDGRSHKDVRYRVHSQRKFHPVRIQYLSYVWVELIN